ncbi:MAG: hypothetical protein D6793_06665 [Thermoflexia bacterium]|nr:MAG: hypothetical protein D6793_06665 [Thermoflexia bacterium]
MERELEGQASVLRISVTSPVGRTLIRQYGVYAVPTFLVFDGNGQAVYIQAGLPDRKAIVETIARLNPNTR